jgi:hypothetical protein
VADDQPTSLVDRGHDRVRVPGQERAEIDELAGDALALGELAGLEGGREGGREGRREARREGGREGGREGEGM